MKLKNELGLKDSGPTTTTTMRSVDLTRNMKLILGPTRVNAEKAAGATLERGFLMSESQVAKQLLLLAEEGEALKESSHDEESVEVQRWIEKCHGVFRSLPGGGKEQRKAFRNSPYPDGKVTTIRMIAGQHSDKVLTEVSKGTNIIVSQSQIASFHNEIGLQFHLNIQHSELSEREQEEAKQLYNEITTEVQKDKTNWQKVTDLLKKSFDYGLKIAPDLVKLADAYYRAKGTK